MRVDNNQVNLRTNSPLDPKRDSRLDDMAPTSADDGGSQVSSSDSGDSIEISDKARELMKASASSTPVVTDKPAIRPDMVERARKMLESGTYNDHGVLERTAGRISDLFSTQA